MAESLCCSSLLWIKYLQIKYDFFGILILQLELSLKLTGHLTEKGFCYAPHSVKSGNTPSV